MINKLDFIMVAYNEADCIEEVLRSFYAAASKHNPVQIIVAEDGSTDGTREILKSLANDMPIKLVLADERRGYAGAVKDALMAATSDTILFVDSDGQYMPDDLQKLLDAWNGFDMIIGEKYARQDPAYRILISWLYHSGVVLLFNVPFKDMDCGYRIIRKELAQTIAPECRLLPYSYWTEFTVRACKKGFKVSTVSIGHRKRLSGESRMYPIKKLPLMTIKQLRGLRALYADLHSNT